PVALGRARPRARRVAVLRLGEIAHADQAEFVRLVLRLGDLLSCGGVGAGAAVTGERGELGHRALEPRRLGQSAAFEPEHRHRDLPAIPRLADQVAVFDLRSREEDLAELAATRHLRDPPHLDAGLLHIDQGEAGAAVSLRRGVGASEQEAAVRVMSPARPCLLTVQNPLPVAPLRVRAQAREIAAGVRLAEALAENELTAQDLFCICLVLPGRYAICP